MASFLFFQIQLTLERHGIERHRPIYRLVFLNIRSALYFSSFWIHGFSQLQMKNSIFMWGWESMDADGQLCALIFAILYKELDHLWILVSVGVLEPILHGYKGTTVWEESKVRKKKRRRKKKKLYAWFWQCWSWGGGRGVRVPKPHVVQGNTVSSFRGEKLRPVTYITYRDGRDEH